MNPSEFSTCYQDTLNGAAPSDELMMMGGSLEFVSPGMFSDISSSMMLKKWRLTFLLQSDAFLILPVEAGTSSICEQMFIEAVTG